MEDFLDFQFINVRSIFPRLYVFSKKKFHGWLDSMPILGVPGIFIESSHYAKHAMPKEDAEY